ncbi:hypothetical protein [Streptomyces sp. NPDC097610]|uniref:hypothetical protein n=1 Tax=Streptomyces sp. NPDC097610 TaxID=3157227 RepID=UPI003326AC6E
MLAALDGSEPERAAPLAAYYVLSYLSMSLPAIATGAGTHHFGPRTAAHAYAEAAALLAVAAVAALTRSRHKALHTTDDRLRQTLLTTADHC